MFNSLKLCIEKQNKTANFRLNILEHEETLILEYHFDYWNTSLPDKYIYSVSGHSASLKFIIQWVGFTDYIFQRLLVG